MHFLNALVMVWRDCPAVGYGNSMGLALSDWSVHDRYLPINDSCGTEEITDGTPRLAHDA
jgi:hypothetical protein